MRLLHLFGARKLLAHILLLHMLITKTEGAPTISCFSVSPSLAVLPNPFRIDVCAESLIPIVEIELWSASGDGTVNDPTWKRVDFDFYFVNAIQTYFLNSPGASGSYWYGVHVKDSFGNWSDERQFGLGPIRVEYLGLPIDVTPPTITSFSVQPPAADLGGGFTIFYNVADRGGSGLKGIELWRSSGNGTKDDPNWQKIGEQNLSGNGPINDIFSDGPTVPGTYWYGIHVVDSAGNTINERQAGLGPISAQIKQDNIGPALNISYPQNNDLLDLDSVTVRGTASDDNLGRHGVSSVTVNDTPANGGTVSSYLTANWSATIRLNPGVNKIVVVATDGMGNQTSAEISVTFTSPEHLGPLLSIDVPANNVTVRRRTLMVRGTASDAAQGDNGIASVFLNGIVTTGGSAMKAETANWTGSVILHAGSNQVSVIAVDSIGNATELTINVNYSPESPRLFVTRFGSEYSVSWSSNLEGFVLQESHSVEKPMEWSTTSDKPVLSPTGDVLSVTKTILSLNTYYRLVGD